MNNRPTYLSKDGLEKLRAELDEMVSVKRPEVANRIHDAKEHGDLSENAEYEDAKNEQAFLEGKILALEGMLSSAVIIDTDRPAGVVSLGSKITVKETGSKPESYTLVGAAEANPKDGLISNESPLGKALLGRKIGDDVKVNAPQGTLSFRVVAID